MLEWVLDDYPEPIIKYEKHDWCSYIIMPND